MEYPLINKDLLPYLRLGHGIFNFTLVLLFFYTGRLGLVIRRARQQGLAPPTTRVRRHRKLGPVLAILGAMGFFAGISLVLVDTGDILKYPAHLLVGTIIVVLLFTTFMVSRKISGPEASSMRQTHYRLGLAILTLYVLEVFLGIGVLF